MDERLQNVEYFKLAINSTPYVISGMPNKFFTEEMCKFIITTINAKKDYEMIEYIPFDSQTPEVVKFAYDTNIKIFEEMDYDKVLLCKEKYPDVKFDI